MFIEGMQRISEHVAAAHLCRAEFILKPGYPNTTNHAHEARFMAEVMREAVGEDRTHADILPAMTAEDFGFMLEARSEEHTSELQSQSNLVCRLLLEKKK